MRHNNNPATITISIAYAPSANEQRYIKVQVNQGTTLYQALIKTGWLTEYPNLARWCTDNAQKHEVSGVDKKAWRVGIFSIKKPLGYVLTHNDRIEVYRPLTIDPQNRRKVRATK